MKLSVPYGQQKGVTAFEGNYAETHMPLAGKMQDVRKIVRSKVFGAPDGSAPPDYCMVDFYFDNAEHMNRVMDKPEAKATVADLAKFAASGVTMLISDPV